MAFNLSRGLSFDESAGIVAFVEEKFLTSAAISRTHFLHRVLNKFDFSSTSCDSGFFIVVLIISFIYFYFCVHFIPSTFVVVAFA